MTAWWRPTRAKADDLEIESELASYVEERTAQGVAAGLDPDEASRRARVEVGGVAAMAQKLREQRSEASPWHWLGDLARDVRYAFRQGYRAPALPLVATLTLGLGIGGAAAMFGLIQGVLLTPPPYADPAGVVLLAPARVDGVPYDRRPTTAQWLAWRDAARDVDIALYRWTFNFLVRANGSQAVGGMIVTPDYFKVLGLAPIRGRTFLESEAASVGPPTAIILGYELWRRSFNSDPDIIGKHVVISRIPVPLPVVGVMPPGIRFLPDPATANEPGYDVHATVDFWVSVRADESQLNARAWNVVGRLAPGASASTADAAVAGVAARLRAIDPSLEQLTATARPLLEVMNEDSRRLLMPLFGAVVLVFCIACANVAGLLLARGLQRQRAYVLQAALGASWQRLFRQALTESLVLALAGAVAGAACAVGMVALFLKIGQHALPRADAVSVGWPVLAFCALMAPIAAAAAGLVPAARAAFNERARGLESARTTATPGERRLIGGVAAVQIVLTVGLLAGAALLVRTARHLADVQPGYDTAHVLTMSVAALQGDAWQRFHTDTLERVSALPGVRRAAFAWGLPLTGNNSPATLAVVGGDDAATLADQISVPVRAVTPDYFAAMDIGLSEGRVFRESDNHGTPPVAIVNRAFAYRYFPAAQALGRSLRYVDGDDRPTLEIVGIVSDMRTHALNEAAEPEVYLPLWQNRAISKHLVIRTDGDPMAVAGRVREAIHAVDPTAAVENVKTMSDVREESVASRVFAMRLLVGFSAVATLLALVGLYGVLSLSVGSRVKEMAVRKAIGAQRTQIVSLVLTEGARLIVAGVALGIVLALVVGRVFRSLLFGVQPTDPMTLAGAATLFALLALATCAVPAWRAARVNLMDALRHE
jgi:putative ABC transport system permease protein